MGSFSPVPGFGVRDVEELVERIHVPVLAELARRESPFRGVLYAGLMLTTSGPRVLEFNCRLGDPETQPLMMRLQSDLVPFLLATVNGTLAQQEAPVWDVRTAVSVVVVSKGYPGQYQKGAEIQGLDRVATGPDLQVFHSGTAKQGNSVVSAGGRVLAVTALGQTVQAARERAYAALKTVGFQGAHFRTDIAQSTGFPGQHETPRPKNGSRPAAGSA
jgi:phosphoribosylamine--glycine ligase